MIEVGLDPEAAEHARTRSFPITAPAIALMMTDGFEALAGELGLAVTRRRFLANGGTIGPFAANVRAESAIYELARR